LGFKEDKYTPTPPRKIGPSFRIDYWQKGTERARVFGKERYVAKLLSEKG